jgi:AraC family transcriptional activator of pobA
MFDSLTPGKMKTAVHVASVGHVARDARWALDAPRSYLVPSLFWFTGGQGRMQIEDGLRGFNAHSAIFLPANTPHSMEIAPRTQGMALFFNAGTGLNFPERFLHLRLHGAGRQSELTRMIEEITREVASGASDADAVLFHQSALLMLWLHRNGGAALGSRPTGQKPALVSEKTQRRS